MSIHQVILEPAMTDGNIAVIMKQTKEIVDRTQEGSTFSVFGYDDDPRELWDIPEVISLFKRMYQLGFHSLLMVSTSVPDLIPSHLKHLKGFGLGAFELWWLGNGNKIKTIEKTGISASIVKHFHNDWIRSNQIAMETIKRVTLQDSELFKKVCMDGQFRIKLIKSPPD